MTEVNMSVIGRLSVSFSLLILFVLLPVSVFSAEETNAVASGDLDKEKIDLSFEVAVSNFEYEIEKRPDPFVPFFTGETNTQPDVDPNEIVEVKKQLTGMQLFEPGQLNLVGLMRVNKKFVAMVEDFKGQGYIIEKGTKIGRRGVVKDIMSNKVLIEEVAVTRAGRELRNEIVMALRKEGEE
jgi:type IV pilus assembly protein PilP